MQAPDLQGDGKAAQGVRAHKQAVVDAKARARAAHDARRARDEKAKALHREKIEAIAADDSKRLAKVDTERRRLLEEDHEAQEEGTRLAVQRAEEALRRYLRDNYPALIEEHLPFALAQQERLDRAVSEYLNAVTGWNQAANVSISLLTAAERGTGRDVPSLPEVFQALRQEVARASEHPIPAPLPVQTEALTARITVMGKEL